MRATVLWMMMLALCPLAACSSSDPCQGLGTCLGVTVMAAAGTPATIDQLQIVVSGQVNGTRLVPPTPQPTTLPQTVALEFNPPGGFSGTFGFQLRIVAENAGAPVAEGTAQATITTTAHEPIMILLGPNVATGADMTGGLLLGDMASPTDGAPSHQ